MFQCLLIILKWCKRYRHFLNKSREKFTWWCFYHFKMIKSLYHFLMINCYSVLSFFLVWFVFSWEFINLICYKVMQSATKSCNLLQSHAICNRAMQSSFSYCFRNSILVLVGNASGCNCTGYTTNVHILYIFNTKHIAR
jgi:hypothetical protein